MAKPNSNATIVSTIPINNFQGTQTSPAVSIAAGITEVTVDFDGSTMLDPNVFVATSIEFAPDGQTWQLVAAANFQCGSLDRQGNPQSTYQIGGDIPPDGSNRKLRGTLSVTGGRLTTTLHISTL